MPSGTGAGASVKDALRYPATPLVRAPSRTDLRRARVALAAELAKMVSKAKLCRRVRSHNNHDTSQAHHAQVGDEEAGPLLRTLFAFAFHHISGSRTGSVYLSLSHSSSRC